MAKSRYYKPSASIELVESVEHKKLDDRTDIYSGPADALERAGVLQAHMLPEPGRGSATWVPENERRPGEYIVSVPGYLKILRQHTGDFRAYVTVSREEQAKRAAATQQRMKEWHRKNAADHAGPEGEDIDRKVAEARRELDNLPKSHSEFRKQFAQHVLRTFTAGMAFIPGWHDSGYSMDQEVIEEFMDEVKEALGILENGTSYYDAKTRTGKVAALHAKILGDDSEFRPFMARLLAPIEVTCEGDGSECQ